VYLVLVGIVARLDWRWRINKEDITEFRALSLRLGSSRVEMASYHAEGCKILARQQLRPTLCAVHFPHLTGNSLKVAHCSNFGQ
jgi:hypothetical protein